MQLFDAKVDKELIQEWTGISRQLGSSSQNNHSGVSDVLGGVPPPALCFLFFSSVPSYLLSLSVLSSKERLHIQ